MADDRKQYWQEIAERRIGNILRSHTVARKRTLEQKICDAGPNNQRPDPHILTLAQNAMRERGELNTVGDTDPWYHLSDTSRHLVDARLDELAPIAEQFQHIGHRIGQCLEIAVFKALQKQSNLDYLGSFPDLSNPGNTGKYSKEDPPSYLGNKRIPHKKGIRKRGQEQPKVDFIILSPERAAIEVKNRREWYYPQRDEIRYLLYKAIHLDCVPVLIARRIPFVTFMLLEQCGFVFHQTYNQLMDERDRAIAEKARDKSLLGYHDIRIGFEPDKRLLKFIGTNLPDVIPKARVKFDQHKGMLSSYASGAIDYQGLVKAIRVKHGHQ